MVKLFWLNNNFRITNAVRELTVALQLERNSFSSSTPGGAGSRRTLLASLSVVFVVSIAFATNDGVELICPEVPTARVFISVPLNYKLSELQIKSDIHSSIELCQWPNQSKRATSTDQQHQCHIKCFINLRAGQPGQSKGQPGHCP